MTDPTAPPQPIGPITTLVPDRLYALHNPYELNGFVSTHPAGARGYAPLNSYLLLDGDHALLIDTGFSAHEQSVLAQIASLITDRTTITIFSTSIGEFAGICNVRPIVETFSVEVIYGIIGIPAEFTDFRPEYVPYGTTVAQGALAEVRGAYVRSTDELDWAGNAERLLSVFPAPLRLLPGQWSYDAATRTLFTSDSFNHVWRDGAEGPWIVQPDEQPPSFEDVYAFLTGTRYWWLPGAQTDELIAALDDALGSLEIDIIAPRFGCVLTDPVSIAHHVDLLRRALRESPHKTPIGVMAGAGPMGGRTS